MERHQFVQTYCIPYYTAVRNWSNAENLEIISNRFNLLQAIGRAVDTIFETENSLQKCCIVFESLEEFEHQQEELFKKQTSKSDIEIYEDAKKLVPESCFNSLGLFFQSNLIDPFTSRHHLSNKHHQNDLENCLRCVDRVLTISNQAGKGRLLINEHVDIMGNCPTVDTIIQLVQHVNNMNRCSMNNYIGNSKTARPIKNNNREAAKLPTDFSSHIDWTTQHESIGTKIAAYFPPDKCPYYGEVVKYAAPSKPGKNDQLYHIIYNDGDEEDYDEKEYQAGIRLYNELNMKWVSEHDSIGAKVAAYFDSNGKEKLFRGEVVKYCYPSTEFANDQLYHIQWEDGDEEDYDEQQLQKAKKLFKKKCRDSIEVLWTINHESVGKRIVRFEKDKRKNRKNHLPLLLGGIVTKFSSTFGENMYKVYWENGVEEELSERNYLKGLDLHNTISPDYLIKKVRCGEAIP